PSQFQEGKRQSLAGVGRVLKFERSAIGGLRLGPMREVSVGRPQFALYVGVVLLRGQPGNLAEELFVLEGTRRRQRLDHRLLAIGPGLHRLRQLAECFLLLALPRRQFDHAVLATIGALLENALAAERDNRNEKDNEIERRV